MAPIAAMLDLIIFFLREVNVFQQLDFAKVSPAERETHSLSRQTVP
jgi:hypothetical protein